MTNALNELLQLLGDLIAAFNRARNRGRIMRRLLAN